MECNHVTSTVSIPMTQMSSLSLSLSLSLSSLATQSTNDGCLTSPPLPVTLLFINLACRFVVWVVELREVSSGVRAVWSKKTHIMHTKSSHRRLMDPPPLPSLIRHMGIRKGKQNARVFQGPLPRYTLVGLYWVGVGGGGGRCG